MKTTKHILTLALTLFCALGTTYAIDQTYYTSIDGKSGSTLRDALYTLTAKGPQNMTYNGLWTAYKTTDVYPSDSTDKAGKIWDMYSNVLFTAGTNQCGTYSNVGDCYNREHSLPKSWFNEATPAYYDLGHIVPTDGKVNGQRSNYPFGECASGTRLTYGTKKGLGKLGTSTFSGYTSVGTVFEPDDIYKGDFARMYMYMVVRYKKGNSNNVNLAADSDGQKMFNSTDDNFGFTDYSIALLMKWHRQDPVSVKEVLRNNGMEKVQGNRNPFIDYPDLAEYLWGNQKNKSVTLSSLSIATGGSSTPTLYDVILNRNGATEQISTSGTYYLPTDEDAACYGWAFAGWSTSSSVNTTTAPSCTTSVSSATTLYAVYSHTTSSAPHRAKMAESSAIYTFTSSSWAATLNGSSANWTSGKAGAGYNNNGVQVTTGASGANATCPTSYSNITSIVVSYCTNTSKGAGTIKMTVDGNDVIQSVSTSDGTTPRNLTFDFSSTKPSGNPIITVTCTTNSIYVCGVTITYGNSGSGGGDGSTTTYKTTPDCGSAHTITLSSGGSVSGGTFEASATSAYQGATITLYADPNDGYELDSWTVTAGGSPVTVNDNQFTMPDANVTISATFTALPTYNIKFYNNGTQIGSTQSVFEGGTPNVPSNPESCEGYTFIGWWTSALAANNTTAQTWITDFTVSGAQDYYAVFSHSETSGGGEATWEPVTSAQNDWSGDYVIVNPDQTHAMTSDFKSGTSGEFMGASVTITNNKVVSPTDKMIWTIAKNGSNAQYSFKNKSTGTYAKITGTSSTNAALDANAVWFTIESTNTSGVWDVASVTNSARCFAYYASNTSFRTYAKNSNNTGYLFKKTGGGGSSTTYYTSSPDCSTPQNVTVSFNANGGTGTMANQAITYNTATALTANTFTRTGYTFQGWATSANGEKVYNNKQSVTLTSDVSLYAVWKANSHNVTFTPSPAGATVTINGKNSSPQSAEYNSTVTIAVTPTAHYSLSAITVSGASGNISLNGSGNSCTFTMPDEDVTVDVTMAEDAQYTINWYVAGTPTTETNYAGEALVGTDASETECNGKVFVGWTATADYSSETTAPNDLFTDPTSKTMPSNNTNYYAVFATETTSGNGSAEILISTGSSGKNTVNALDGVTCSGLGSDYSSHSPHLLRFDDTGDYIQFDLAAVPATLSFGYKMIGGNSNSTMTVEECATANGTYSTVQAFTISGAQNSTGTFTTTATFTQSHVRMTFTKGSNVGVGNITITSSSSSTTYTGYTTSCSTPTEVTVTFNANYDGADPATATQTIPYNTATALTANTFTRTGYTFQGWATSANGEKVYNNSASVTLTENTTLYALWTVNSYTITTNAGTGGSLSTSPSGNANFGETVTITVTPDGTHTVGSVSVKDASNNDISVSGTGNERTFTMPASNVTVSATFNQKQQYSINFIVDGETISTQNLYEGATAQKPTDPTACEGYTFVGWWTSTLAADNTTAQTWITDFTVSGAQDYYAVFSHTETSGSGGGSTSITLNAQTDKEFPKNGITLSVTDGALNNGTDYRVYKNQKLTITSTVGDITSIALTYSGASYDGGGWSDSYTPNAATWTSPVANGEQARITKIVITIDGGSSSSTTYYTSSPDCVTPCSTLATPVVTATPSNGQITLTWADVEGADHYSVTISKGAGYTTECGNAANISTITGTTTKTCVITGLTNGLTYTTSVVAHATSETCDSEADEDTAIPTECEDWTDPTLTWSAYNLNTTGTNTATCSISGTTHGTRSFESSNTEVLTVASDGTVTAVGAGTATVTVSWTAADGYCEKSIISDAFEVAGPLTISFDANGGEGTMSDQTVTYKVSTAIKENAFTRTGYIFQGWALTAAGSKEYNDKQSVAFTNSLTLYAVWQLNSHEVTFTSSVTGATVTVNGQSSSPQTAEYGSTVTLLITPTEHYIVSALTVSGTSGSVDISGTGNTRTFTMPDEAVTVTLTMVAESQYTATFYNGAETFATVSGYADDDIAAPTGTPTSCDEETYTFVGWVATAQASEVTTCPEILTFPQVMTSGGVSYYALFRRSEGGSGGEASVTFKTASSDSNTEYTTDSDIKTHIVDNYTGIASFEGSKSYPGKSGVKLGSSKNAGSITLTLSSPITTDKITVEAEKYDTDAGDLKIEVNGNTTFGSALSPAGGTLEFTDDEMEISSLTVLTTTARAYVASISLGGGGTNYYMTAPECEACENQVTITKGTAEHGTFQLSKADGSYDNCKNNVNVIVSNITPDYGYYCSGVTATGSHMHVAVSGPDGSGNYTVAYAKGYSITSTINVVFEPLPTYTIRFIDNGSIISTQTIYDGAKAVKPTDPTPCDGYTFFGWWTAELDADNTTAETWITDFTATKDQDYYAVYRYTETSGGGSSTITLDASTDTSFPKDGITLTTSNGVLDNGTDYRIYKGATLTITSSVGDMTSIAFTFDGSYNGGGWETSYTPNSDTWTSPACTSGNSGKQARIKQIVITIGGSGSTTTYYTTAPDCEAPIVTSAKMLVAEFGGARVALAHDNTNTVAALPLMYFGGNYFIPNIDKNGYTASAPEKATLTWQVAERTDGYYIKSDDKKFLAQTEGEFALDKEKFLWPKSGALRLAYDAATEAFVVAAGEQGELPGITPVDVPSTISTTELKSQRDLTIGKFGTICLPHAVALPFTWGVKVYSVKGVKLDDNNDFAGIYMVEETEMLVAGKPYLIEAVATQMNMWYATGAPTADKVVEAVGLVGNLDASPIMYAPMGEYIYILSDNKLRHVAAENKAKIGQYKAYFDLKDVGAPDALPQAHAYKVMYVEGSEQVATDVNETPATINWDEPVYNILGMRVDRNATGVLIQGGTKFIIRVP